MKGLTKVQYDELKKTFRLLRSTYVFDMFDKYPAMIYLFDETSRAVVILCENDNESYSIYVHRNLNGINSLYDNLYCTVPFFKELCFATMLHIVLEPKGNLSEEDIKYLHRMKKKVMPKDNLIPYFYKEGYPKRYAREKECAYVTQYLYYIYSLIRNEKEGLVKSFDNDQLVVAAFDNAENVYQVYSTPPVLFETMPPLKKINQDFVYEYQDKTYVDDTLHLSHSYYTPLDEAYQGAYPSILLGYYEKQELKHYVKLDISPSKVPDFSTGFLDEVIKLGGLPTKIIINHRSIYAMLFRTLEALKIEVVFERSDEEVLDPIYDIIELFDKEAEEGGTKPISEFVS